jgi:hypothetical protein
MVQPQPMKPDITMIRTICRSISGLFVARRPPARAALAQRLAPTAATLDASQLLPSDAGESRFTESPLDTEQRWMSDNRFRDWRFSPAGPPQIKRMFDFPGSTVGAVRREVVIALCQCVPEYRPDPGPLNLSTDQATKLRLLAASHRSTTSA